MRTGFYFLIVSSLTFIMASCGSEKKEESEDKLIPIEKNAKAYSEALYGVWKYDMPFMEKELAKLRTGFINLAKKKNKNFKLTPEMSAQLDTLLIQATNMKERGSYTIEFVRKKEPEKLGKIIMTEQDEVVTREWGFESDPTVFLLLDSKEIGSKKKSAIVQRFRNVQVYKNTFTRDEKLEIPNVDSAFVIRHKYIRQ